MIGYLQDFHKHKEIFLHIQAGNVVETMVREATRCYGDTSNILILHCIKIIDTYNTSEGMYHVVRVIITKSSYNLK